MFIFASSLISPFARPRTPLSAIPSTLTRSEYVVSTVKSFAATEEP